MNIVIDNGGGERGNGGNIGVGHAIGVTICDNHFVAADRNALVAFGTPYNRVRLDGNCYDAAGHHASRAVFGYAAKTYVGFAAYRAATKQDRTSTFGAECDTYPRPGVRGSGGRAKLGAEDPIDVAVHPGIDAQ